MSLFRTDCDCCGICGGDCPERRRVWGNRASLAMLVLAFCLVGALVGCASAPTVVTQVQVQRVTLPAGLLSCSGEPVITGYAMQSQVADYIARLHEAWADCHEDVASIARIENTPAEK